MEAGMSFFFKMQVHSASSPVAVTYITPCMSQTLWQMITWPKNYLFFKKNSEYVPNKKTKKQTNKKYL